MAWWEFEGPFRYPGYDGETLALHEAGLLGADELAELMVEWRREFDKAQRRGFWVCLGPGEWLEGAAAKRAHYRHHQIPPSLIQKWSDKSPPALKTPSGAG